MIEAPVDIPDSFYGALSGLDGFNNLTLPRGVAPGYIDYAPLGLQHLSYCAGVLPLACNFVTLGDYMPFVRPPQRRTIRACATDDAPLGLFMFVPFHRGVAHGCIDNARWGCIGL